MYLWVAIASVSCRRYSHGDPVTVYANVIGPRDSQLEVYPFLRLPFCFDARSTASTFADSLLGNPMTDIGATSEFKKDKRRQDLCAVDLTETSAREFAEAVEASYWGQFYVGDIPAWCKIGDGTGKRLKLFTKFEFWVGYNDDRITQFNVSAGGPVEIVPNTRVTFGYSVIFYPSNVGYEDRFEELRDRAFSEHPIHSYSVMNNVLLVLLLMILVTLLITKILAKDYNRFMQEAEFDGFDIDLAVDSGWRTLHADVFRPPCRMPLVSMLGGAGMQSLLGAVLVWLLMSYVCGQRRDGIVIAVVTALVLSAPFGGFWAVSFGRVYGYPRWLRLAAASASVVPFCLLVCYLVSGLFGLFAGSARSLALGAVLFLLVIHVIVVIPLAGLGGVGALKLKMFEGNKCEVSLIPRSIPRPQWYARKELLALALGLVCTSSVIVEAYYILTAIWQSTFFYAWQYFIGAILSLSAVAICATVLSMYVLLQSENYRWQWLAFSGPASTGVFVFLYCLYFMITNTHAPSLSQRLYFFMYSVMLSAMTSIFAGGDGLCAGNVFVHLIYANLKLD